MKKVLLLIILLTYNSVFSQSNEKCYTFSFLRTDIFIYGSFYKGKKKLNYNHIMYISPVYTRDRNHVGSIWDQPEEKKFRNKYSKDIETFISKQSQQKPYKLSYTDWGSGQCYLSKDDAVRDRKKLISRKKEEDYEIVYTNNDENSSKPIKEKTYFTDLKIDENFYVTGYVTIKSKFVFFGYPYIVSEYQDLIVTNILIRDKRGFSVERFDAKNDVLGVNKVDFLPYKPRNKPLIDANFWIWTPNILNPNSERKEHYKVFNYPVNRIATITDNFGNKEVDAYFKAFNHSKKNDDYFWSKSLLKNPKVSPMNTYTRAPIEIKNISGTLSQELKTVIKKYNYSKNYDFWGNRKKETNKKKKKDDFWKN